MYEEEYTQAQVDEMVAKLEAAKAKNKNLKNDFYIKPEDACDAFRLIERGIPENEAIQETIEGIDEWITENPFEWYI